MPPLARIATLLLALAGCVLMVVAEFMTLYEIRVITVVRESDTGGGHHGYALLVIGVVAAVMAYGAIVGASRPAAWALLVLAVAALVVVFGVDFPDVGDEGFVGVAFERAEASPQTGFYVESLGAVLLLIAAAATLVLGPRTEDATPAASPPE